MHGNIVYYFKFIRIIDYVEMHDYLLFTVNVKIPFLFMILTKVQFNPSGLFIYMFCNL